jgi:hypothetical protein
VRKNLVSLLCVVCLSAGFAAKTVAVPNCNPQVLPIVNALCPDMNQAKSVMRCANSSINKLLKPLADCPCKKKKKKT